jgi:acyl-[acyl-carrier-protein] desaturase
VDDAFRLHYRLVPQIIPLYDHAPRIRAAASLDEALTQSATGPQNSARRLLLWLNRRIPVSMDAFSLPDPPQLQADCYRLYREFFDLAESKRRWSLRDDIPWKQCNQSLDPAIADVVESFCAVELYLPDYVASAMSIFRSSRAYLWFYANWGYEESKHSLALGDWLLRSGMRTEEQIADLEERVFTHEWNLPHNNRVAMLIYAMVQELATGLNYRNLKRQVDQRGGDLALSKLLGYISVDEQSHHSFFTKIVRLYLQHDRPGTLRQLHHVLHTFNMPAIHEMVDGIQRVEAIKALGVFNQEMYFREVYLPVLTALGVSRKEMCQAVMKVAI